MSTFSPDSRRTVGRCALGVALLAALASCSTSSGGGGSSGVFIGSACNAGTQKETCSGTARLVCASNVWTLVLACGAGEKCLSSPAADGKGLDTACVAFAGGSDVSADGTTADSSGDVAAQDAGGSDAVAVDTIESDVADVGEKDIFMPDAGACVNGKACNDGDGCTTGDTCVGTVCKGKAKNCDDGDACTADSCQNGGCVHTAVSCADGTSMDKAIPLSSTQSVADALATTGVSRWFQFNGQAGDFVYIAIQSAQAQAGFDPSVIDSNFTLYTPDQQPYAMNDDVLDGGTADSGLFTKLPQAGTYYIEVSECWTWKNATPGLQILCGGTPDKTDTAFQMIFIDLQTNPQPEFQHENEGNGSIGSATPIAYTKDSTGNYFLEALLGDLSTGSDVDYFGIAVPADVKVPAGRLSIGVGLQPGTVNGDGSPLEGITATLFDASTAQTIAKLDLGVYELRVPVQNQDTGAKYALKIQHNGSSFTTNDWYVLQQTMGGSNPVEVGEAINNTLAGAQLLVKDANSSTSSSANFFIGGDIINNGSDVDYFAMSVPSGMTKVTVSCGSKYMGSGVLDFAVQIFTNSGTDLSGGAQVESGGSINVKNLSIPFGTSKVVLKLAASGQDASVSGTFYECGIYMTPVATP